MPLLLRKAGHIMQLWSVQLAITLLGQQAIALWKDTWHFLRTSNHKSVDFFWSYPGFNRKLKIIRNFFEKALTSNFSFVKEKGERFTVFYSSSKAISSLATQSPTKEGDPWCLVCFVSGMLIQFASWQMNFIPVKSEKPHLRVILKKTGSTGVQRRVRYQVCIQTSVSGKRMTSPWLHFSSRLVNPFATWM